MKRIFILMLTLAATTLACAQTGISIDDSLSLARQAEAIRSAAKAITAATPNGEHLYLWKFGTNADLIYSRVLRTNDDRVAAIKAVDSLQFRQNHSDMGKGLAMPFSTGAKLDRLIILSDFDHKPASNSPFFHKGWTDFAAGVPAGTPVYLRPFGTDAPTLARLAGLSSNFHLLREPTVRWRTITDRPLPPPPQRPMPRVWRRWLWIGVPLGLLIFITIAATMAGWIRTKRWERMEAAPIPEPVRNEKEEQAPIAPVVTVPRYGLLMGTGETKEFTADNKLFIGSEWDADLKVDEPGWAVRLRLSPEGAVELFNCGDEEVVIGAGVPLRPHRRLKLRPGARAAVQLGTFIFTLFPLLPLEVPEAGRGPTGGTKNITAPARRAL